MTQYSVNKLHYPAVILMSLASLWMAISEKRLTRMYLLVAVLTLQHATLLLFMYDYDKTAQSIFRKKKSR